MSLLSDSDDGGPPEAKIPRIYESSPDVIPQDLLKIYETIDTVSDSELVVISESESDSGSDDDLCSENDESHDVKNDDLIWSDVLEEVDEMYQFTRVPGLERKPGKNDPVDYYRLFFNDEFIASITEHTNNYAATYMTGENSTTGPMEWTELKPTEFKTFLGLLIHMGHIQIPHISDYWNKDPLFNMSCFSSHMSVYRFLIILKCLQFAPYLDSTVSEICKLRGVLNHFNKTMSACYKPAKDLKVDVPVTMHKGRIVMSHDPKRKSGRHGIKLYSLTDAHGVVIRCSLFADEKQRGKVPVEDIVMDLMSEYLFLGHSLYMVEYYTSHKLAVLLAEGGTYCTGLLRADRVPESYKVPSLNQGQLVSKYSRGIGLNKWRDRRHVHYITSQQNNRLVNIKSKGKIRTRPQALVEHEGMFNTKRSDDIFEYYPCERLQVRCYKKFYIHIIQMILLNSYRLYCLHGNHKIDYLDFRLNVVRNLLFIKKVFMTRVIGSANHVPTRHAVNDKGKTLRKRCKLCYSQGSRKDTTYYCAHCPDSPSLCLQPCFARFHHSDLFRVMYR